MRRFAALPLLAVSLPAFAHPGHIAEQADHTHWLAFAAFGAAVAIGVGAIARVRIHRRKAALNG